MRTYSELIQLPTFEERFEYLSLEGSVGVETFGFDRYLNQVFYHLPEWRRVRRDVIARDMGCDLGLEGYDIYGRVLIHHMNPILPKDIENRNPDILNPEFLITTCKRTHDAIHYGAAAPEQEFATRTAGDTCPWK